MQRNTTDSGQNWGYIRGITGSAGADAPKDAESHAIFGGYTKRAYRSRLQNANLTNKQRTKKEQLKLANLNLQSMQALGMRETFPQIDHTGWPTFRPSSLQYADLVWHAFV